MDNFTTEMMQHVDRLSKPEKELFALYLEALDTMDDRKHAEFTRLVELANALSEKDRADFMDGIVGAAWDVIEGDSAETILERWQEERRASSERTRQMVADIVRKKLAPPGQ